MRKLAIIIATGVLLVAGVSVAAASIPGSAGVINGCYKKNGGNLKVIDAEAGQSCPRGYRALNWNQSGPPGPAGPPGTPGLADVETVTATAATTPPHVEGRLGATATCPAGKTVLSGGYDAPNPASDDQSHVWRSAPTADMSGWRVDVRVTTVNEPWQITVYAICATVGREE